MPLTRLFAKNLSDSPGVAGDVLWEKCPCKGVLGRVKGRRALATVTQVGRPG